jgi:hypothetical protein
MEAIAMFTAILVGLVGLDLAALRWGVDSREIGGDREDDARWSIR